ncbi:hypothetical protein PBRA_004967 [Plasmodiophora brassicae]|nr:hypothetical protein PBRA_004967 [Plasmodiophora brassicae]
MQPQLAAGEEFAVDDDASVDDLMGMVMRGAGVALGADVDDVVERARTSLLEAALETAGELRARAFEEFDGWAFLTEPPISLPIAIADLLSDTLDQRRKLKRFRCESLLPIDDDRPKAVFAEMLSGQASPGVNSITSSPGRAPRARRDIVADVQKWQRGVSIAFGYEITGGEPSCSEERNGDWSEADLHNLAKGVDRYGSNWSMIIQHFGLRHRSERDIRRRWLLTLLDDVASRDNRSS